MCASDWLIEHWVGGGGGVAFIVGGNRSAGGLSMSSGECVLYKYMYLARQPEIEQTKGTTGGNVCVGTKVSTSDSRYSDRLRWG